MTDGGYTPAPPSRKQSPSSPRLKKKKPPPKKKAKKGEQDKGGVLNGAPGSEEAEPRRTNLGGRPKHSSFAMRDPSPLDQIDRNSSGWRAAAERGNDQDTLKRTQEAYMKSRLEDMMSPAEVQKEEALAAATDRGGPSLSKQEAARDRAIREENLNHYKWTKRDEEVAARGGKIDERKGPMYALSTESVKIREKETLKHRADLEASYVAEELADTEWMADHHKKVVPQNAKITKAQKQANKDAAKQQEQMNQEVEHKPEQLQDMSWLKDHKDFDVGHVAKPTKIHTQRQDEAKKRLRKNAELKAKHALKFAITISETASDKEAMDKLKYAITQVMRLDPPFEPPELKQASTLMMKRTDMYYAARDESAC